MKCIRGTIRELEDLRLIDFGDEETPGHVAVDFRFFEYLALIQWLTWASICLVYQDCSHQNNVSTPRVTTIHFYDDLSFEFA